MKKIKQLTFVLFIFSAFAFLYPVTYTHAQSSTSTGSSFGDCPTGTVPNTMGECTPLNDPGTGSSFQGEEMCHVVTSSGSRIATVPCKLYR